MASPNKLERNHHCRPLTFSILYEASKLPLVFHFDNFIMLSTLLFAGFASAYTVVNTMQPFMEKNIDPLVFPGQYNQSHLHSFYGSDAITINTKNSADLVKGCTNSENPNDLSAYWVPTVLYTEDKGKTWKKLPLGSFKAYYSANDGPAEIPFPQNLNMIAGNAKATGPSEMIAGAQSNWFCPDENHGADKNGFPDGKCKTTLQQVLYFPQCVNPSTLETAYKANKKGPCPSGMKSIPQLRFSIRYNMRNILPGGWQGEAPLKLACGAAWCSHGDFMMGWPEDASKNLLAAANFGRDFQGVNGKLGSYKAGPTCKSKDADPTHGTSDYAESVKVMGKRAIVLKA